MSARLERILDRIKLIAAGMFVVVALCVTVLLLLPMLDRYPDWIAKSVVVVVLFAFLALALALFNKRRGTPHEEAYRKTILRLEAAGLLVSDAYQAQRAFQVEEFEDEGSHYFVELVDGRVLFLSGQYLYQYEPEIRGSAVSQPRRFPCAEFVVRRHKTEHYAVDVMCSGAVIEPEVQTPPFDAAAFGTAEIPEDGEVIRDRTYDSLKAKRLGIARQ